MVTSRNVLRGAARGSGSAGGVALGLSETLEELIVGAYAAALDDTLWVPWADQLLGAMSGAMGSLVALDTTTGAVQQLFHLRAGPKVEEQYVSYGMGDLDPQMPYALSRPRSGYYLDTDHLDLSDPKAAEFTRWLTHCGLRHYMTTVARLGGGRIHAGVSIHRAIADGPTPVEEQRKLAAILPQITRAMELGFIHGEKLLESYWSGVTAGAAEPALMLDAEGRVARVTPALRALLASGDGLDIRSGSLRADQVDDDAQLQVVLSRASARISPRAGAARVRRRGGKPPFVVTAFPLRRPMPVLGPPEPTAIVMVVDPGAAPGPTNPIWREAFGFTPREDELAVLLMAGHSLESAAAVQATTLHTARVHLRRLFAKTGTSRQSDLVRLLGRLSL